MWRLCFLLILLGCEPKEKTNADLKTSPNQVELFAPGFISTGLFERDIAISPDGSELIYTLGNYDQTLRCLVILKKEGDAWSDKQIIPFSGRYNDIEPFYSVDGKQLYFASDRPMDTDSTRTDYNIWVSQKLATSWSEPQPLDTIINTTGDEFYPSLSKHGNLFFTATRNDGIGREDIFMSKATYGTFEKPVVLDSMINTATFEFNAYINPNEDLLIFSSFGREDGLGGGDLYYSKKDADGYWTASKNLGNSVNSNKLDFCPFIDYANGNFYFSSTKSEANNNKHETFEAFKNHANKTLNGMGNIYRISLDSLPFN